MQGQDWSSDMPAEKVQKALSEARSTDPTVHVAHVLPGPTGESNRLTAHARDPILCLGPGSDAAAAQAKAVTDLGGIAVQVSGALAQDALTALRDISGGIWWGDADTARHYARALSKRKGPILPLITGLPDTGHVLHERHVCVDTTAAGGNAALLGGAA